MKIGLIIYGSLDNISGGYLYDRKLVEFLENQGDQVEVVSIPQRSYGRCLVDNWSSMLFRRLEALKVDVLLQDELNHPSLAWINHRLPATMPVVAIVHHLRSSESRPAWQNYLYAKIEQRFLRSVDGFIFNSRTTRQVVAKQIPAGSLARQPNLVALPAGDRFQAHIDPAEINARCVRPGALDAIFIGNLIPRKGLHVLITALAKIGPGQVELKVIGDPTVDPTYSRRVQHLTRRFNLSESIKFLGALDDSALAAELRQAQILVVPSSYEGYGIVYLEGMGFGLPAIAGETGAASEIITHSVNGYLISVNKSQDLADILVDLAGNRQLLIELSQAARQRYLVQPTWQETGQKIRTFLLELRQ